MHYDASDDTLRYANGNEVPDDTAVFVELRARGLVLESGAARPVDFLRVRREVHATATAKPVPRIDAHALGRGAVHGAPVVEDG